MGARYGLGTTFRNGPRNRIFAPTTEGVLVFEYVDIRKK